MATGSLTIDLNALAANWRALDAKSDAGVETAAVVKASGYGLGVTSVARRLAEAGARRFFVAVAEEGALIRQALGPEPEINVFSGHMAGDGPLIRDASLTPMLNSTEQAARHLAESPGAPFGVQLDTGMNRLGLEASDWAALKDRLVEEGPTIVMSHLACADEPDHAMNAQQLKTFQDMTDGLDVKRSLSATGGILLGPEYHFDLTRPGVGLYGGLPFSDAHPVAYLDIPVVQIRSLDAGETVGYGNTWTAERPSRIATISAGYADGLIRAMGANASLFADGNPCPVVGRVSMDLITVDVTDLEEVPDRLELLGPQQTVDDLANAAGTIGYEILTSLGDRYIRWEHDA
ncbi:MAG: alanine racemase [Pseudomonadota bacterium]